MGVMGGVTRVEGARLANPGGYAAHTTAGGRGMRRCLLIAFATAMLAGCAAPGPIDGADGGTAATETATRRLQNAPGAARAVPFRETVFGLEISDPYRWMEDPANAEEMRAWVLASSAHARAQIASLPGREALRAMLDETTRAGVSYSDVQQAGGRTFARRLDTDAALPKLVVREADGAERVLLDPAHASDGAPPTAINNYTPSPSGELVAVHRAPGGAEVGAIRFMRVDDGSWLPDVIEPVWGEFGASWIDEREVIYTRMSENPADDTSQNHSARIRTLGRPGDADPILLGPGTRFAPRIEPVEFPIAMKVPRSAWAIGFATGARADSRVFVARVAELKGAAPRWREIAGYDDRVSALDVHGDQLYYVTTREWPNGELRRLDLAEGTLATSQPVLRSDEAILVGVTSTLDGVYVLTMKDGVNGLTFLPGGRGPGRTVELPAGAIYGVAASSDGRRAVFSLTQWMRARRYLAAEAGVARELGIETATWSGASDYEAIAEEAVSADGTRVPMTIMARRGAPRDSRRPTFLDGYGSYGAPTTPYYDARRFAWLARGGVFAECGVRGGGEKGRAWHEAGRAANKPNAHADFIACAERLIELKLTSPAHLAISGTSAGGLLAPPAALKRPDLFKVVVPRVAITNPTRLAVANNGPNQYAEMGDPTTEAGFQGLVAQDAYLMLDSASASPDWFLTIGLNDRRVDPWMSAKFAARALERFGKTQLVFVRSDADAGHGIGSTRDQTNEEWADTFAFLLNRFGDPEFQLQSAD
jgi:prolyl oligopeptidase